MKKLESDITLVVGAPGTGKTSFILKSMKLLKARHLIVSLASMDEALRNVAEVKSEFLEQIPDGYGRYKLAMDKEMNELLKHILTKWFNSHLIFDDFFGIVGSNPRMIIKTPILTVRHNCNPCFFMFQNLNDCAPFLYQYATRLFLFKTSKMSIKKSIMKLPRADEIIRAKEYIDRSDIAKHDYALIYLNTLDLRSEKSFTHYLNTNL